jgi:hypothetical protein
MEVAAIPFSVVVDYSSTNLRYGCVCRVAFPFRIISPWASEQSFDQKTDFTKKAIFQDPRGGLMPRSNVHHSETRGNGIVAHV